MVALYLEKDGEKTLRGYGYHGRGNFCSLKCGYRWAMAVRRTVEAGYSLKK